MLFRFVFLCLFIYGNQIISACWHPDPIIRVTKVSILAIIDTLQSVCRREVDVTALQPITIAINAPELGAGGPLGKRRQSGAAAKEESEAWQAAARAPWVLPRASVQVWVLMGGGEGLTICEGRMWRCRAMRMIMYANARVLRSMHVQWSDRLGWNGTFGESWRGEYRGRPVAVKCLGGNRSDDEYVRHVVKELNAWQYASPRLL
jgi:hypothetical protein